jgi:hypothetical protein
MNRFKMIFFGFALISSIFFKTSAQDAKNDITKINKAYTDLLSFSENITYTLYSDFTSLIPNSTEKGVLVKSGNNQYMKISSTEIITAENYQLVIESDNKIIMYGNKPAASKETNAVDLDKTLKLCNTVTLLEINGKDKGYKFEFAKGTFDEYAAVSVWFDTTNYLLSKITLYYNSTPEEYEGLTTKPRMDITYSDISVTVSLPSSTFAVETYLSEVNGTVMLNDKYQNYRFIDNRIKE